MVSLRDTGWLTQAAWLAVLAAGFISFIGLIVLRFQRRGAARFWAAPAHIALCLLPPAVAAIFSAFILRETLGTMALVGSGAMAAIAAGTWEALTPLLLGLVEAVALTAVAFVATAIGSTDAAPTSSGTAAGWVLLGLAMMASFIQCVLVATLIGTAARMNTRGPHDTLGAPLVACLVVAAVLVGVLSLVAVVGAFVAPRGPSGLAMKAASLGALALCGLAAVAGFGATAARASRLMETATTGVADGEIPEPYQPEPEAAPADHPPPPPPPPPPRPVRRTRGADAPTEEAVRVGGAIREPRKIHTVNPVYPDIAKQARVQGVVILEARISPEGRVTTVRVLRGIPLLDASAVEAVRQWVYTPTLVNGVPVPVIMTITVNYRLSSGPPPSS